MNYQRHFERNPAICGGETVVKGTRVTVRTLLASLAEGATVAEILEDFPTLKESDVRAVIAFAAASADPRLEPQSHTPGQAPAKNGGVKPPHSKTPHAAASCREAKAQACLRTPNQPSPPVLRSLR
ncbi:MAG: DUF433 domain-containing protein [Deltaproteobacteria bacterium]|nr:DUF433 domain-containing protein [Deltaproteobacteria bacterium]